MRIHRSNPDDDFTILPNEALRDHRLSYTARGILAELLSHSDGWDTSADALWRQAHRHRGARSGEGKGAIRAAFRELEEFGYLVRRRTQGDAGRFATTLHLYDDPALSEGHRRTDYRTSVNRTSADRTSVTPTSKRSTKEEELSKEELSKEHFTALASTRAAADAARENDQAPLDQFYAAVDRAHPQHLHDGLLVLERRRPRIYRECRELALAQIEQQQGAARFKRDGATRSVDALAYKYALQHYAPKWPVWLVRPIGVAVRS